MVTVAILGAGFMGAAHAANFGALGDRVRVKTVVARSRERAQRVAETVGAEIEGLAAELLPAAARLGPGPRRG